MDYCSNRSKGCRIFEYHHRNSTFVVMENDSLRMTIWVDKGCDIVEIIYKPQDVNLMWKSPNGIRDITRQIPTCATTRGNNNDYYPGGWHEALPGGGPYTEGGNVQGMHGEVTLMPWSWCPVCDSPEQITLEFSCELARMPLKTIKTITINSNSNRILFEETIENTSRNPVSFMWGHHPTFGEPLLGEDTRLIIPSKKFHVANISSKFVSPYTTSLFEPGSNCDWPITRGKNGDIVDMSRFPKKGIENSEMLYLDLEDEGWYALVNDKINLGVAMAWDINIFPYIWYWKNLNGLYGFPWYGEAYNIGVEFWTGWPSYEESKEKGQLLSIQGYDNINTQYSMIVFEGGKRQVKKVTLDGVDFN